MKDLIKSNIPDQTLEALSRNLAAAIEQVEPHFTAIPSAGKIGIRTMSTAREGYVRLVSGIATEHVNALPRFRPSRYQRARSQDTRRCRRIQHDTEALLSRLAHTGLLG